MLGSASHPEASTPGVEPRVSPGRAASQLLRRSRWGVDGAREELLVPVRWGCGGCGTVQKSGGCTERLLEEERRAGEGRGWAARAVKLLDRDWGWVQLPVGCVEACDAECTGPARRRDEYCRRTWAGSGLGSRTRGGEGGWGGGG